MSDPPTEPRPRPIRGGSHIRQWVQVAVVAVIVLVLLGLAATAIMKARESASRTGCHNNLRQLGLGLHMYADWKGHFPAATCPNPELPPERRLSWMFEIDP